MAGAATPKARAKPANGKAPRRAAAVAVAEVNDTNGETVEEFHGVQLRMPARLPQTFMMDFAEMQEMQLNQRPEAIGMACTLVKSVIGDDQWRAVRNAIAGELSDDGGAKILGELLSVILNGTTMELGESTASGTP